ncbi:MAG: hypothetical protein H7039_07850, partial [Bryobacteraceae bacterium]|nr:hypothetical protein [Bryobacteraceae bacterium]
VRNTVTSNTLTQERQAANQRPASSSQKANEGSSNGGGSIGTEVLKTVGLITGVGPLVTGLLKLFGGGSDEKQTPEPLVKYQLPSSVAVDAGLLSNRTFSAVNYAQDGQVRSTAIPQQASQLQGPSSDQATPPVSASGPTIQIQVNAMDSRSFLEHSDEIAQAVRAAMLRSHSLNDVVSEL